MFFAHFLTKSLDLVKTHTNRNQWSLHSNSMPIESVFIDVSKYYAKQIHPDCYVRIKLYFSRAILGKSPVKDFPKYKKELV